MTSKIKAFLDREVEKAGTLTELHRCGDNDDAELAVELVLRHGIDVNSVAKGGRTPFFVGKRAMFQCLCENTY